MDNRECDYEWHRKKVLHMSIRIRTDGTVIVTVPYTMSKRKAQAFVESKAEWIRQKQEQMAKRTVLPLKELEWNAQKEQKLTRIVKEQFLQFEQFHIPFPVLRFRKMVSRYGSCNVATGVVTLNKALADMPEECAEYVAAHELAHLVEANHSRAFYEVLNQVMPDHRIREKRLKEYALRN